MQVDWDSLHEQRGICTHATYLEAVLGTCVARWVDQRLSTLCCFDHLSVGAASSGYDADCIVLQGKGRKGKLCQRVASMPYACLQTPLQAAIPGLPSVAHLSVVLVFHGFMQEKHLNANPTAINFLIHTYLDTYIQRYIYIQRHISTLALAPLA